MTDHEFGLIQAARTAGVVVRDWDSGDFGSVPRVPTGIAVCVASIQSLLPSFVCLGYLNCKLF